MASGVPASGSNYEKIPLRKDNVIVGVIQSWVHSVDANNPGPGKKENLQHMLSLIDMVQQFGRKDFLVFHEFPLAAMSFAWNRKQALNVAIDVPGEETEIIGKKAKQYNCYIHFGCYGKIKEWPDHFINMAVILGPTGDVVYRRWKMRNMSGMGFGTTIYDVLDKFVEMYGGDALFPIGVTDIGNIAVIPETMEPEMGRAYAMKGAEMVVRYMTAGAGTCTINPITYLGGPGEHTFRLDFQAQCLQGHYWGLFVNNSLSRMGEHVFDLGAGHSAIFDPNGRMLIEASSSQETYVQWPIPMAEYRKTHQVPHFPKELYQRLYEQYVPKYMPNSFLKYLPDSIADSMAHGREFTNW